MDSPYTPPQSEDPLVVPQAAGKGIRLTVRILSLGGVVLALILLNFARTLSSGAEELGFFKVYPYRTLASLLLWCGGALPFVATLVLSAAGLILSSRIRSRALPMLAFAIASLLWTIASFVGTIFLMLELVRVAGAS